MRRKYRDCKRQDGNCTQCELVIDGKDCHDRAISKLEWARLGARISQKGLAELSGVKVQYIQNVELGKSEAGNMSAKNIIALANALRVKPDALI